MAKFIFACFAPLREGNKGGLIEAMKPSAVVFLTQDFKPVTRDLVLVARDQIVGPRIHS